MTGAGRQPPDDHAGVTLGVDVGSLYTKVAVLGGARGETLVASRVAPTTGTTIDELDQLAAGVLSAAGLEVADVETMSVTGGAVAALTSEPLLLGRPALVGDELTCVAAAVSYFAPDVARVIHVGGQSMAALRIGDEGEIVDYLRNDKCAAGTGRFVEMIGARLCVPLAEVDARCAEASSPVGISEQCVVFAESEAIGQLNAGATVPDLLAGVAEALASIVAALGGRLGGEGALCITGGVGRIDAVVDAVSRRLRIGVCELELDPQLVPAIGAALLEPADDAPGGAP